MDLLLPVCISLAALGLVLAIVLWLRGRRGRAVQAFGFAALPVGLYLTGLLGMIFDAVAALGAWAAGLVFNPAVWAGVGLLGIAVVLWVVGGMIARRTQRAPRQVDQGAGRTELRGPSRSGQGKGGQGKGGQRKGGGQGKDDATSHHGTGEASEFDDIEELLRRRGIE